MLLPAQPTTNRAVCSATRGCAASMADLTVAHSLDVLNQFSSRTSFTQNDNCLDDCAMMYQQYTAIPTWFQTPFESKPDL
jgi:hypothetical protein